jgi:hypothetical protein
MNENTSQAYSSTTTLGVNSHRTTISLRGVGNVFRRILIVAAGYMLTSMLAGRLLGRGLELSVLGISLLSGILIASTLALIASRLRASPFHQWIVWGSVLFFNTLSLGVEGAFYAPTRSPMISMPIAWTAYLLLQSLGIAGLIAWLFRQNAGWTAPNPPHVRAWHSWAWRFVVSAFSYLVFYFIFGAVNYALVTRPYYAAHVSGLVVPPPQTVLMAEIVRAPLIVLSIVPLILLWRGRKSVLGVACGMILFVIGGVVPLLLNPALPDLLRFASAIEIFFQNFLTGVVAVALLGFVAMKEPMDQ